MDVVSVVIASVGAAVVAVGTLWLFVWAARKDGEDQATRDRQRGFHRRWP